MICLLGCFASKEKREYCIHETLQDNYQQKINCLESFVMFVVFLMKKRLGEAKPLKTIYLLFNLGEGMRCSKILAKSTGSKEIAKEIGMPQRSAQAPLMAAPTPPKPKVSPSIIPEAIAAFCGKIA